MRKYSELVRRFFWAIFLVLIMQIGKNITLPGFPLTTGSGNYSIVNQFLSSVTGGNFSRPTIFTLGIGPYMTGLIIWTTISMIDTDRINNISERNRSFFQKLIIIVFASVQAFVVILRFRNMMDKSYFNNLSDLKIMIVNIIILVAGAMLVSWLADVNCQKGIGAQMIFVIPGLIGNLPGMLVSGHEKINVEMWMLVVLFGITLIYLLITLFLYKSELRIFIERTGIDNTFSHSYIPIRLLTAGAMPFMFALTIFSIPPLLLLIPGIANTWFSNFLVYFFAFDRIEGILMYGLVIFLLGLGFSFINVRPHDIAKNLKNSGDYIFGIPPGEKTEKYFKQKLYRISFVGNSYLVLVSLIPLLIGLKISLIGNLAFYFGSLTMLIVILDNLIQEIRFIFSKKQYDIF
ncbi:accessory Sec system protein translocase subunit SecY2 [Enterococcus sp. AZ103]|uniref:accessory Sec system protein translocase subunit SecY2 n=1 Tax=Enterococcus sp. AZ103 TaxID=2774628 RepID=UPI003F276A50